MRKSRRSKRKRSKRDSASVNATAKTGTRPMITERAWKCTIVDVAPDVSSRPIVLEPDSPISLSATGPCSTDVCDADTEADQFILRKSSVLASMVDDKVSKCGALGHRLRYHEYLRTLNADFEQCHCQLRLPYLRPVGKQLKCLTDNTGIAARTLQYPPHLFSDETIKQYQKKEGVCCWWCCHDFAGPPVGCPVRYRVVWDHERKHKRREFTLHGYFCSYPCALAYGQSMPMKSPRLQLEMGSYFRVLIEEIAHRLREQGVLSKDYQIPPLAPAPHFSTLKIFGGDHSIDEFRRQTVLDNGHELTIVPDWLNIIPSGMVAYESPRREYEFATDYNTHLAHEYVRTRRERRKQAEHEKQKRGQQKSEKSNEQPDETFEARCDENIRHNQKPISTTSLSESTTSNSMKTSGNALKRPDENKQRNRRRVPGKTRIRRQKNSRSKRFRLASKYSTKNQIQMSMQ